MLGVLHGCHCTERIREVLLDFLEKCVADVLEGSNFIHVKF
jgi:hypothetical protein